VDFLDKATQGSSLERTFKVQEEGGKTLFLRVESETQIGDLTVWDEYGTFHQVVASFETGDVIIENDGVDWRNSPLDRVFVDFLRHFK